MRLASETSRTTLGGARRTGTTTPDLADRSVGERTPARRPMTPRSYPVRCLFAPALLLALASPGCGPTANAGPFRVELRRPVEELEVEALAAVPPSEGGERLPPDLVDLSLLDPALRFDIRYAGSNNFMGAPFYRSAVAYLQRPVAEALVAAHRELLQQGFGLLIFDAYRPWYVTWMFWEGTPENLRHFVANPASGSRHNRGAAVDLTLYHIASGSPAAMGSGYDEFTERSHIDYPGVTAEERENRDRLRGMMEKHGFSVYRNEWWHFDHRDWAQYPILNLTFEELGVP